MSVMRELRRRLSAEQSLPRFDPCLPRVADRPPAAPGWIHEISLGARVCVPALISSFHLESALGVGSAALMPF